MGYVDSNMYVSEKITTQQKLDSYKIESNLSLFRHCNMSAV